MKIQKVFEAFEQFRLGEETLAQLVTQLEASLIQVLLWIVIKNGENVRVGFETH